MTRRRVPAVLLVLLCLVLPACGDDDGGGGSVRVVYSPKPGQVDAGVALPGVATPKPQAGRVRIDIQINKGVVQTGVTEVLVKEGSRISFSIQSDRNDELVVKDYESIEVKKGQIVQVGMNAVLVGLFSVDLKNAGVHVLNLRVVR